MSASEATYAHDERSPSTVVDIPSFTAYLKQERDEIVIPLRDGKNDTGCSKDSEEFQKVQTARWNRLKDHLDMLKQSPMNKEILERSNLIDTLRIIATASAFDSSECKNTAQALQARFASPPYGADKNVTLGLPEGDANCTAYGHNGLTPGRTWLRTERPNAAVAVQTSGAHGVTAAGIYGHPLSGAYSVSLKYSGGSLNRDEGTKILYGTRGGSKAEDKNALPAPNRETYALRASIRTKIPLRLLRFRKVKGQLGPYGPAEGWRYDGLYRVTAVQEATNDKGGKFEQFTLERSPLDDNEGISLADFCDGSDEEARKQIKEELGADKDVAAAEAQRQSCNVTVERGDGEPSNAQGESSEATAKTMEQDSDDESQDGDEEADSDE